MFKTLLVLIGFTLSLTTNAALVDDGNTMIDTATGLRWLDLTETIGETWNDVEGGAFVTGGGYAHATTDQVKTLFDNAGFLSTDNTNDPLNNPAATLLLGSLGCTLFCGTVHATGRGFAWLNATWTTRPNYHTGGLGAGAAVVSLSTSDKDLAVATVGHFLVRPVPLPAAAWLFGSALLGLVGIGRRKKA